MTRLVVERAVIADNLKKLREYVKTDIVGVLDCNGFGAGLTELAALLRSEGVETLAVSCIGDAVKLRAAGSGGEILLLRPHISEGEARLILEHGFTATVTNHDGALTLNGLAAETGGKVRVRLRVDTGLGLYGFAPGEADMAVNIAKFLTNLEIVGVYTDMLAPLGGEKAARAQNDVFGAFLKTLADAGVAYGKAYMADSYAALRYPFARRDGVFLGPELVGLAPHRGKPELTCAAKLVCDVAEVRWLPKGHRIGRGGDKTGKPVRIAVLTAGYADGFGLHAPAPDGKKNLYPRRSRFGGPAPRCVINGKSVKLTGGIGAAYAAADVTGVETKPGDSAFLRVDPVLVGADVRREYV